MNLTLSDLLKSVMQLVGRLEQDKLIISVVGFNTPLKYAISQTFSPIY